MLVAFMVNLLCAIVPCDPQFKSVEISDPTATRIGKRFSSPHEFDENPTVFTKSGVVEGYITRSSSGHKIYTFEGIPYAESPSGNNRFKSPVPKRPWSGVLRATKVGPDCLQMNPTKAFRVFGSEDCLSLNIYSAKIQKEGDSPLLPAGSEYGQSYLLNEKVILVNFNYRLGILGFLSTLDKASSGNFGLKDQHLAIKWIYENIENFGGDKSKITLVGHSAGGASVGHHLISHRTRPYFQAAVSMSGTAFNKFGLKDGRKVRKYTETIAKRFYCFNESVPFYLQTETIVNCLKSRDPIKLVSAQKDLPTWGPLPITMFAPVVESKSDPEAFLVQSPQEAYAKKDVHKVPYIATVTEEEGLYVLLAVYGYFLMPTLRSNFSNLAPKLLEYQHLDPESAYRTTKKITNFYFPKSNIKDVSFSHLSQPFSDRIFLNDYHEAIQAHSKIAPTYAYVFRYKGKYNVGNFMGINTYEWGAGHAEDLFYLFNSTMFYHGFQQADEPELKLSQLMVSLFTNFASKREPLLTTKTGETVKIWKSIDPSNIQFLQIDNDIKMIPEPFVDRIKFWKSLNLRTD